MSDDDGPRKGLDRTFAPMLSELEDAEVRLVAEHTKAVAEVRRIDAELDRLAKVKRVMLGEPKKPRATTTRSASKRASDTPEAKRQAEANRERVMGHLATLGNGRHFTAAEIARATGMPAQGLGPILSGLERHGMVEVVGQEGMPPHKRYRVAAEAEG